MSRAGPRWDTLRPPPLGAGRAAGVPRASLGTGKGSCGWETRTPAAPAATRELQRVSCPGTSKDQLLQPARGGVRGDASMPMACGTQERLDLSIPEVTDVRKEARSTWEVVHPPTGPQSLGILC